LKTQIIGTWDYTIPVVLLSCEELRFILILELLPRRYQTLPLFLSTLAAATQLFCNNYNIRCNRYFFSSVEGRGICMSFFAGRYCMSDLYHSLLAVR
jgi:hypothetical protein